MTLLRIFFDDLHNGLIFTISEGREKNYSHIRKKFSFSFSVPSILHKYFQN